VDRHGNRENRVKKKQRLRNTLITFDFFPRLFSVLVKEAFIPSIWVPPSTVRILLAYPSIVSEYASSHLEDKK
jgi:hypothetical protein